MKNLFSFITVLFCTLIYAQDKIIVHTSTAGNSTANATVIDHPDLNDNPSACLSFVHNFNPSGTPVVFNDNPTGLSYNTILNRWIILNEAGDGNFVVGSKYNVYIADNGTCIDHIADSTNIFGNETDIDDPNFNESQPGPYAFFNTLKLESGPFNPGVFGMKYTGGSVERRTIFNESFSGDIPEGAAFKVLVPGGGSTNVGTHTANASNIILNFTILDRPQLNGNPDATFLYTHYYGVNGPDTEVRIQANTGAYYYTDINRWCIATEDGSPMPVGVAFDFVIAPNETLSIDENLILNTVIISPNPATNVIKISSADAIMENITIYSILGTEIMNLKVDVSEKNIDVSALASGTYLVNIKANNTVTTQKFIKI